MLVSLHVKNMALIREEEISFGPGLNILTGETGAGKSVIIGSVGVALGASSFRDFQPEDAQVSLVEMVFETEDPEIDRLLQEKGIEAEEGQLILARKYQNGRTINRINGESVSIGLIREIAGRLIDIHGQHEHQSLLKKTAHRKLLDAYCASYLGDYPERCAAHYREYRELRTQLENASMDLADRQKQIDFLRYEAQEISAARLQEGEDEELEQQFRRLSNGQKIISSLEQVREMISSPGGASDQISRALREMTSVGGYDDALREMSEELSQIEDLTSGFERELAGYLDDFSYDEGMFQEISDRLDLINRLKAKYGKTIREVNKALEEREKRIAKLEDYENWMASLESSVEQAGKALLSDAQHISEIRRKYAADLEREITQALSDLNFLHVRFEVDFRTLPQPLEHGCDEICFMISLNPGMPMRPLQDVASGGELSRIMLAIKAVMAEQDEIGTLIFDEIDEGISGRTAQKVSEKMAVIARRHQVICITHLPQIAAMADTHLCIEKNTDGTTTQTSLRVLDEAQQTDELARLLGGVSITDTVRKNAEEMKQQAKKLKQELSFQTSFPAV